jgi:regulator of protease activity HflC (stomatin/prohibitin superfamily)
MDGAIVGFTWAVVIAIFITLFGGTYVGWKNIQVWSASKSGQAVLAEAEYSRKVRIEEARAKQEAAELEGQAELTRAEYAARANEELSAGLGGSENYLRYMFIRMLEETGEAGNIIYIPTEGGMPILEAGRATQ